MLSSLPQRQIQLRLQRIYCRTLWILDTRSASQRRYMFASIFCDRILWRSCRGCMVWMISTCHSKYKCNDHRLRRLIALLIFLVCMVLIACLTVGTAREGGEGANEEGRTKGASRGRSSHHQPCRYWVVDIRRVSGCDSVYRPTYWGTLVGMLGKHHLWTGFLWMVLLP